MAKFEEGQKRKPRDAQKQRATRGRRDIFVPQLQSGAELLAPKKAKLKKGKAVVAATVKLSPKLARKLEEQNKKAEALMARGRCARFCHL